MLRRLTIYNYAIIDELEIDFSNKLNVITGETGAGKSIIAGALGLILGERADTNVLLNREKKCVVEGFFNAGKKLAITNFLKEHDLDTEEDLVIRREIGVNGKSRAFINDTPVNLYQLQQLGSLLVDLHQQFDTLTLGQTSFQREVLDALAFHNDLLNEYRSVFHLWQTAKKQWSALREQKQLFDKETDYNQFQFNELADAGFRENELEELEAELKMLNKAEEIKETLSKVFFELKDSDTPILAQLKNLFHQVQNYSSFHPDLPEITERLQSVQIELQDIADETENISRQMNFDADKIEQLNERLSLGYKLQKKHGVRSTNELIQIKKQLQEKLDAVLNIDETIKQKEKETELFYKQAIEIAELLSNGRQKQTMPLQEKVNRLLIQVGMPNARLKVDMKEETGLNEFGKDAIEFLFDANKSNQFLPVRKVASGGELSRLMLCIKSLVAKSIDLATLIFDEIDTGISGEAARQVGIIMKELADKRQLICITHQPQIAGKADSHFFVYKESRNNMVKTCVKQLTESERITTIAKMLSGEKPTAAAIENAREMVVVNTQ
jgi:DNA repair protein RecN (Recombination protein N)